MILTKKGSTRGSFHFLTALTLILILTRIIVQCIESGLPSDNYNSVDWKNLPALSKEELKEQIEYRDYGSSKTKSKPGNENSKKSSSDSHRYFKSIHLDKVLTDNTDQKPILLLVTDETNPACHYLHRVTLTNPELVSFIEKNFYPIKLSLNHILNYTEYAFNRTYANSYLLFVPYMVVIDPAGKKINRNTANFDCVGLKEFLEKGLKGIEELEKNRS